MSSTLTTRLLEAYIETAPKSDFLAAKFRSPAENFFLTEDVEVDLVRSEEDVAVVITDLSQSSRSTSADIYTNKRFTPPIYSLEFAINSFDLLKRVPGSNPFEDPQFQLTASRRFLDNMRKVQAMIFRSIEQQASQVLQTGKLDLKDAAGVTLYSVDFKPKTTHFVTAGTAWNASADIVGDITSMCNVIRDDGKEVPNEMNMGEASFEAMISDTAIQARLDNRRIDSGDIRRMTIVASGGQFRGTLDMGNFTLDVWTYAGRFNSAAGVKTRYIDDNKVIIRADTGRLDAVSGNSPRSWNDYLRASCER